MRGFFLGRLLVCALFLPFAGYATSYYLVTTGHATANTQLDVQHTRTWSFAPAWNWDLGGGTFVIKDGPQTAIEAVLTLYLGGINGTALASAHVPAANVTNSYAPVDFLFGSAVTLTQGNNYSLVLTSATPDTGSTQYFIKGEDNNFTDYTFADENGGALPATDPALAGIPEPSTWAMIGLSLGLGCWRRLRRKP